MKLEIVGQRKLPTPAAVLFLALLPVLFLVPITHDAIWQIWIGRQLLGGARLYTDIVEVNPPLWFWTAIPLAWVGDALGIPARYTVVGFFCAAIGLSLILSPKRYRILVLVALSILPLKDFGQREHFTLISVVPYVFLIAARAEGKTPRHAWLIGFFAAFGFALKPYFIIVPLALEILVASRSRFRPETMALAISAIVYAIAVLFVARSYLTNILPMLQQTYAAFAGDYQLQYPLLALGLGVLGAIVGRRTGSSTSRALALTSVMFLPAAILQAKGWSYHTIPVRGFLFLAVSIELINSRKGAVGDSLLIAAALLCFMPVGVYRNYLRSEVEPLLLVAPKNASIVVLTSNPSAAWPMVEERHFVWPSKQFCFWQIAAAMNDPKYIPPLRRVVIRDLETKPDVLVIDRLPILAPIMHSIIPANYLREYKLTGRSHRFEAYVRKRPAF